MANYFDDLADLDDVGTLEMGLDMGDEMGIRNPFRRRRARRDVRAMQRKRIAARALVPQVPGVPMPGARLQPLGLGATAFTSASGAVLSLVARPQRPFKGQRLVVDITRTGATATGLVTITRLDIGTSNQLVSSGSLSAAAFAATAFDVNLQLDPATPGIDITVQFAISVAPLLTDRVDISGTIFGTTVG